MKNLQQAILDLHAIASTLPQDNDINTRLRKIADELHEYVNADLQTRHKIVTTFSSEDRLTSHEAQQAWVKNTRRTEF
jgi:hypothetical protein